MVLLCRRSWSMGHRSALAGTRIWDSHPILQNSQQLCCCVTVAATAAGLVPFVMMLTHHAALLYHLLEPSQ